MIISKNFPIPGEILPRSVEVTDIQSRVGVEILILFIDSYPLFVILTVRTKRSSGFIPASMAVGLTIAIGTASTRWTNKFASSELPSAEVTETEKFACKTSTLPAVSFSVNSCSAPGISVGVGSCSNVAPTPSPRSSSTTFTVTLFR